MSQEEQKCAHEPCVCTVPHGEEYCSDWCRETGSKETEIGCDCHHAPCS